MAMVRDRSALADEKNELRKRMRDALTGAIDALVGIAVGAADDSLIRLVNVYYHLGKSQGRADAAMVFNAYRAVERVKCDAAQLRADPRREPVEPQVYAHEVIAHMKGPVTFSQDELRAMCQELGLPLREST